MAPTKLYTAEDLLDMEGDSCRHELIRGELITLPPTTDEHSLLVFRLSGLLWNYQTTHPEVRCFAGDPGFVLARDPDILLGPDLAAVHTNRLPPNFPRRTYFDVVPDLVIEIDSPAERVGQINRKVWEYLNAGVKLVWLVDPAERNVTVHAPTRQIEVVGPDDTLDGGDVLPDFRLPLSELFR